MAVGIVRKAGAPADAAVRSNAAIEGICGRHLKWREFRCNWPFASRWLRLCRVLPIRKWVNLSMLNQILLKRPLWQHAYRCRNC